ncbi:CBO0543 family protein [Bacillus sp. FJAT-45350]|uniref:CBO0543 family protein n=1 Tax=Bacillus sp. FJAT-45350 TaxID=2011014 RepID=UPI000BB954A7|nr:CBO0543 family protein [Bacillus sp. FJAT-45350]
MEQEWNTIIELRKQTWELHYNYWLTETLFSFNWWLLLTTTFLFFIIWIFVLDKSRLLEIMTYGLLVSTIAFILDLIGITMVLWSYPDRLTPLMAPILEIHKMHMPVIFMIIYQYFHSWRSFITVMTLTSGIFAFALEPLLIWLQIYEIHNWRYIYSFPLYIIIGVFLKWLIGKLKSVESKHKLL